MNCSPPGSSVLGISQTRILEWVAIPFSRGSSWPRNRTLHFLHWQADSLPLRHQGTSIIDLKFPSTGVILVDSNEVRIWMAESHYEHAEVTWEGACFRALENLNTRRAESSTTSANSHVWVKGFWDHIWAQQEKRLCLYLFFKIEVQLMYNIIQIIGVQYGDLQFLEVIFHLWLL